MSIRKISIAAAIAGLLLGVACRGFPSYDNKGDPELYEPRKPREVVAPPEGAEGPVADRQRLKAALAEHCTSFLVEDDSFSCTSREFLSLEPVKRDRVRYREYDATITFPDAWRLETDGVCVRLDERRCVIFASGIPHASQLVAAIRTFLEARDVRADDTVRGETRVTVRQIAVEAD